jgi:cytochrome c
MAGLISLATASPYHDSDFATQAIGVLFDVNGPENNSPNNTGLKKLPPATKAMIWYPYRSSDEFPDLGKEAEQLLQDHFIITIKVLQKRTVYRNTYDKSLVYNGLDAQLGLCNPV